MTKYIEKRQPFTLNLAAEQAICGRNYARVMRLFPGWKQCDEFQFEVKQVLTTIRVEQRDRYSSVFAIYQTPSDSDVIGATRCRLRVYHDAQMVDITEWNGSRRFQARYEYPNPAMLAADEKWQLNRFLGEWLDHCLKEGLSVTRIPLFQDDIQE